MHIKIFKQKNYNLLFYIYNPMGGGGRSSSHQNYNSQSTTYATNTMNEANHVTTNTNMQNGDTVT